MKSSRSATRPAASLTELLALDDADFVRCLYVTLLDREADSRGLANYLALLHSGADPLQLVGEMALSEEGRRVDARLPGLEAALKAARLAAPSRLQRLLRHLLRAASEDHLRLQRRLIQRVRLAEAAVLRSHAELLAALPRAGTAATGASPQQLAAAADEALASAAAPQLSAMTQHAQSAFAQLQRALRHGEPPV